MAPLPVSIGPLALPDFSYSLTLEQAYPVLPKYRGLARFKAATQSQTQQHKCGCPGCWDEKRVEQSIEFHPYERRLLGLKSKCDNLLMSLKQL